MFQLTDFHLFGVNPVGVGTAALGFWALRRVGNRTIAGKPIDVHRKPWHRGAIWGGFVLGAGWALTGACPGTAIVQVGQGKLLAALSTVSGILAGTYLYGWFRSRPSRPTVSSPQMQEVLRP